MQDISYKTDAYAFSYRVAGVCIQNDMVLLQKPDDDEGYAFPGGQAAFGETNAETLVREFREETGAEICVNALKWVGEIFFSWGALPCQQLCLYYDVQLRDSHTPTHGSFRTREQRSNITFYWVPISELSRITLYPENAAALLSLPGDDVHHFIYRES